MGIESAVYRYEPTASVTSVVAALRARGVAAGDSARLVVRGPDHFIDLKADESGPSLHLRVAFTNPPSVVAHLQALIRTLETIEGGGVLTDLSSRRTYSTSNEDALAALCDDFLERREGFQRMAGPVEAAVSADDVHALLREGPAGI